VKEFLLTIFLISGARTVAAAFLKIKHNEDLHMPYELIIK
jgi:hypothetical protein